MLSSVLPKVVYDVQPGGSVITSMEGGNAVSQGALDNQIKAAQLPFVGQQAQANLQLAQSQAASAPLNAMATIASNPMIWALMPAAQRQQMTNYLANTALNTQQKLNGLQQNQPQNNQPTSFFGRIANALLGNNQNNYLTSQNQNNITSPTQNNINPSSLSNSNLSQSTNASPLVPGANGMISGITAKVTHPYVSQVSNPGETFYDPNTGKLISTPTGENVTMGQQAISGLKRVEPVLNRLVKAQEPFSKLSAHIGEPVEGFINTLPDSVKNFIQKTTGIGGDLPTFEAQRNSELAKAPEQLLRIYQLPATSENIARMSQVVQPQYGETSDQYSNRIRNELNNMKSEEGGAAATQLGAGYDLSEQALENQPEARNEGLAQVKINRPNFNQIDQSKNTPTDEDISYTAKKYNMTPQEVKNYLGLK